MKPKHVLQGTTAKEELLLEAELFSFCYFIIRVENLSDVFRGHLVLHRPVVIAMVKRGEIKGLDGLRFPEAEQIAGLNPVTKNWGVVGDPLHFCLWNPTDPISPLFISIRFSVPAKLHSI